MEGCNLCRHCDLEWVSPQDAVGNHFRGLQQGGNVSDSTAAGSADWRRAAMSSPRSVSPREDGLRPWKVTGRQRESRWPCAGRTEGSC